MTPTDDTLRLPRSPDWPRLRDQWLRDHPTCAACGATHNLQVHHKVPVHVNRSLELTPANLITLCENTNTDPKLPVHCHLQIGHLGNWFNYNKNVDADARKINLSKYDDPNKPHFRAPVAHLPRLTTPEMPPPSAGEAASPITPPVHTPSSVDEAPSPSPVDLLNNAPAANPATPAPTDPVKNPSPQRPRPFLRRRR